ncbi:MAG: hypothetical protein ACYC8T_36395 [Myxococcaceae bacterium]
MSRWPLLCALLCTGALAAGPTAMQKFQEGMALSRQGKCAEALVAFEEAQRLKPVVTLWRRIAECREKLGQLSGARDALVSYLGQKSAPDREAAAKELGRLEAKIEAEKGAAQARALAEQEATLRAEKEAAAKAEADARQKEQARALAEAQAKASQTPPAAPPTLDHRPLVTVRRGEPVLLRVRVTAPTGRAVVPAAFLRVPGVGGYSRMKLEHELALPELWSAKLPASYSNEPFDYYVELLDETGQPLARVGSAAEPMKVSPAQPPSPLSAAAAPSAAIESESGRGTRTFAMVTATLAGAALLAGGFATVTSRNTLSQYDDGRRRDNYQEISQGRAREAEKTSQLGAALLGGGGALLGLSVFLVF